MLFVEQFKQWLESGRTNMEKIFATVAYTVAGNAVAPINRIMGQDALGGSASSGVVQSEQTGSWFQSTWPQTYSSAIFGAGFRAWSPDTAFTPDDYQRLLMAISATWWRNKTNNNMGPLGLWPSGSQTLTAPGNVPTPMLFGGNPLVIGQQEQVFIRLDMPVGVTNLSVAAGTIRVSLDCVALNHYPARAGAIT